MWESMRDALERVWQRSQAGLTERRAASARARFWAEVREGEREAEAGSRPSSDETTGSDSGRGAEKSNEERRTH